VRSESYGERDTSHVLMYRSMHQFAYRIVVDVPSSPSCVRRRWGPPWGCSASSPPGSGACPARPSSPTCGPPSRGVPCTGGPRSGPVISLRRIIIVREGERKNGLVLYCHVRKLALCTITGSVGRTKTRFNAQTDKLTHRQRSALAKNNGRGRQEKNNQPAKAHDEKRRVAAERKIERRETSGWASVEPRDKRSGTAGGPFFAVFVGLLQNFAARRKCTGFYRNLELGRASPFTPGHRVVYPPLALFVTIPRGTLAMLLLLRGIIGRQAVVTVRGHANGKDILRGRKSQTPISNNPQQTFEIHTKNTKKNTTYDVAERRLGIGLLDVGAVRLRVQEEGAHGALRLVGILFGRKREGRRKQRYTQGTALARARSGNPFGKNREASKISVFRIRRSTDRSIGRRGESKRTFHFFWRRFLTITSSSSLLSASDSTSS